MGDEFQSGICGSGNWWNNPSSKSVFGSSPCSSVILNDHMARGYSSGAADDQSCSVSDGSIIFHDIQKPQSPNLLVVGGGTDGSTSAMSMDSTLQMMCIGLSSPTTTDWQHESLLNGKADGNYHHNMLQEQPNSSSLNYRQENGDWITPKNFTTSPQDSSLKSLNQLSFSLDQQQINSITSSPECIPMSSASSYGYPSTLLQTIFDTDTSQAPSPSQFNNSLVVYSSNNYKTNLNEFSPSFPKFSSFLKSSSLQQKPQSDHLPLFNMASAGAPNDTRASFFPSMQSQFLSSSFEEKPNCPNLTPKANNEEVGDSGSLVKKSSIINSEPAFKRPRIQTPSPLPTFKVRKEKLGDRVTALQQLVSPFGKTDTASVLHEAIEYIKLLHDQVHISDKVKDGSEQGLKKDLRSRGLCLVPISSTFPVAAETTTTTPDFWAPTFGATTFR
ncbi:hypothetical protein LguiB_005078 [Lonicera macranthoides]